MGSLTNESVEAKDRRRSRRGGGRLRAFAVCCRPLQAAGSGGGVRSLQTYFVSVGSAPRGRSVGPLDDRAGPAGGVVVGSFALTPFFVAGWSPRRPSRNVAV